MPVQSRILVPWLWLLAGLAANAVQVTYQVNLAVQIALGNFHPSSDTIFVSGTFSNPNWIANSAASNYTLAPLAGNSNVYAATFNIVNTPGTFESHKFVINPGNNFSALNWENVTGGGNRFFQVGSGNLTLPVVYFGDLPSLPVLPFIAGADLSLLPFFEARGIAYRDGGQTQDALAILKARGLTCARLRLFTSSAAQAAADAYNYTNNLSYNLPLAARIKSAGLQLLLDFHYSDTWADPAHQAKPAAWTSFTSSQLVQQMHDYNSNCIAAFAAAGAMPDYVQIGNEITAGLLWTNGDVGGSYNTTAQWSQLGQLMKAAVQGIRDASGTQMPKVVVHIDRGGDWATTQWFFDNLVQQQVPFDIIGESYYPFYQGPLGALANCLTNAAKRYAKPVLIAETAFPWTNSYWTTNLVGLTPSVTGQVQFVVALAPILKGIPAGLGAGVFWWGTEYQRAAGVNEAGFNTTSFFDSSGNVLPVADAFGQLATPIKLSASMNGGQLSLNWPLSGAASSLMTTSNLQTPTPWSPVTNFPQATGTGINLLLPVEPGVSRFYRLQGN